MTLRESLQQLSKSDKELLIRCLESGSSQYIELQHKTFIGVNIFPTSRFLILESNGKWSYGRLT